MWTQMKIIQTILLFVIPFSSCQTDPCHLCFCINNVFTCKNLSLTVVPQLTPSSRTFDTVDLMDNDVQTLKTNTFLGTNVSTVNIDNNLLSSIATGAFNGIERKLTNLSLRNNFLPTLPGSLRNLTNLTTLDLRQNPITAASYDRSVLRYLGKTLKEFHFGHNSMSTWPTAMEHLPKLQYLDIDGTGFNWMPINAFRGFRRTLTTLYLRNTQLTMLPQAVSKLENIEELHFDGNTRVGDDGILASAFLNTDDDSGSPIRKLSLQNNSLTKFPPVFQKLEKLEWLSLDGNALWYISDNAIDLVQNTKLKYLSLSNCKLDRIPGSILRIKNLTTLVLNNNNIISIDVGDLYSHTFLKQLDLSGNPLKYISPQSFHDFPSLAKIDLSRTQLVQIPTAIANVPSLTEVTMDYCAIECTCDLMWLHTTLHFNPPNITGLCETVEYSIEYYLSNIMVTCPT